jgi:hypothetical protein
MFVSSFHATKLVMGVAWKMPPLDDFVYSLTCEQDKIVQMGALRSSKAHALATNENSSNKFKKKVKGKKDPDPKKDSFHKSCWGDLRSKKGENQPRIK